VASLYQVPFIILMYLVVVLVLVPQFMKNRPAYSLKTTIQIYNLVQIAMNIIVLHCYVRAGMFIRTKLFLCPVGDWTVNEDSMRVISWAWNIVSSVCVACTYSQIRQRSINIQILLSWIKETRLRVTRTKFFIRLSYRRCRKYNESTRMNFLLRNVLR